MTINISIFQRNQRLNGFQFYDSTDVPNIFYVQWCVSLDAVAFLLTTLKIPRYANLTTPELMLRTLY